MGISVEDKVKDMRLSIHEIEIKLSKLEKDSHPPIFTEDSYEEIDARLQVLEAFLNNIKLITTNHKEID